MDKKIILYLILGFLIVGLLVLTFFPNMIYIFRDSGIVANSAGDKCIPPPGTSEEEWREHMSHHPDIYMECLQ